MRARTRTVAGARSCRIALLHLHSFWLKSVPQEAQSRASTI